MIRLKTVTLLFFAAMLLSAPVQAQTPCQSETDEFTETKTAECPMIQPVVEKQPTERLHKSAIRLARVSTDKATSAILMVITRSDSWNFLSENSLYAIIDGERYTWKLRRGATDMDMGSVIEGYHAILTKAELNDISSSNSFRLKLGTAVFDLSDTDINEHASALAGQ